MLSDKKKPIYTPMTTDIPCLVLDADGRALFYDEAAKRLSFEGRGKFTSFPTKTRANHAIWHQVQADRAAGVPEPWLLYQVVEQ